MQQRTSILTADFDETIRMESEFDEDFHLFDRNRRNLHFQEQLAHRVRQQINATIASFIKASKIHLNVGQRFLINRSSIFISVETLSISSLMKKEIRFVENARLRLPSILHPSLHGHSTVLLLVRSSLFSRHRSSSCLVNHGTFGSVWHFSIAVEHAPLSIDLFDFVRSAWK